MNKQAKIRTIGLIFILLVVNIGLTQAEPKKLSPALEEGIGEYKHENYEEALRLLKKAREEDPKSTLAAYYLGLNYKQLQDYKKAAVHLRDAVTYTPKIKGALIELIDCLNQLGQLEEANKWIEEAQREGIRPAQVSFLKGLVRIKEERYDEAIQAFEDAKARDQSLQQASDYQIGVTHLKAKEFEQAQEAFEVVADLRPTSNLALYANEYIDAISERVYSQRPWKFSFTTAWQYDDNVVLAPEDTSIATDITDQSDWRTVYSLQTEYNYRSEGAFGFKGRYNLYYAKQNDLGFYDTMAHAVNFEPRINFKKSILSFPFIYSHTTVDDRSYLSSPSVGANYNFSVGDSQMGQAYAKYTHKNFLFTPSAPTEDRDGDEFSTGLGWFWFFAKKKGFFNLSYGYNYDKTHGDNWEYYGNRLNATVLIPLLKKLNASVATSVYFQDFENTHTVFGVQREDTVYTASTLLAYKLTKNTEFQAQYTFIKDDSNIGVFNYERKIVSAGFNIRF